MESKTYGLTIKRMHHVGGQRFLFDVEIQLDDGYLNTYGWSLVGPRDDGEFAVYPPSVRGPDWQLIESIGASRKLSDRIKQRALHKLDALVGAQGVRHG